MRVQMPNLHFIQILEINGLPNISYCDQKRSQTIKNNQTNINHLHTNISSVLTQDVFFIMP